jgi:hypothetical protein
MVIYVPPVWSNGFESDWSNDELAAALWRRATGSGTNRHLIRPHQPARTTGFEVGSIQLYEWRAHMLFAS